MIIMDSNIIVEPLECLPCALNACDMFVVSKTLMDKVRTCCLDLTYVFRCVYRIYIWFRR